MSLLHDVIKELNESAAGGATGASAIAAFPGSLMSNGKKRAMKQAHRIDSMSKHIKNRNAMKWRIIGEMVDDSTFDAEDVMSKLNAAEKKARNDRDTTPFGLEDDQGNIVKVYVRTEQADEFETALSAMLSGQDEDGDEQSTPMEIAEVLFQLKDKFDIVDVEWPEIEGDVEEEQEVGDEGEGMDLGAEGEGDLGGAEGEGMDLGAEGEGMDLGAEGDLGAEEPAMEPEGGAESALQQVIDMMKADAEARKAESEARAKEAEARTAEANASAAASKVKQEEDVLDMEAYNKQQKEEEEESKRLAKLAKWKHDQASKAETRLSQEEEEAGMMDDFEPHRTRPAEQEDATITKDELMQKILHYLQAN